MQGFNASSHRAPLVIGMMVAVCACEGSGKLAHSDTPTRIAQLFLTAGESGDLTYCAEQNRESAPDNHAASPSNACQSLPNPRGCTQLRIDIYDSELSGGGFSCSACTDSDGGVTLDCDSPALKCLPVFLPNPDCLICAYDNGAILFSSCIPAPPSCDAFVGAQGQDCEVCYDPAGGIIYDSCAADCRGVACPQVDCSEGYAPAVVPGDCCDSCLPKADCTEELECPAIWMSCPDGTVPYRHPLDCCAQICVDAQCSEPALIDEQACPPGTLYHAEFPACGTCVPTAPVLCDTHSQCASDELCIFSEACAPACDGQTPCGIAGCVGQCGPSQCPGSAAGMPNGTSNPMPSYCEGQVVYRTDWAGCGQYQCVCPGGIQTYDGSCPSCASATCGNIVPDACSQTEHLEFTYPNCCSGTCVPNDCGAPESSADCSRGIACPEGFTGETNPATCCEQCVASGL